MVCCWGECVRVAILAVILMLATPVFAVELFRYRGAAEDGGTLECVFESNQRGRSDDSNVLPRPSRSARDARVAHQTGHILARPFFGHRDRTAATDVLGCSFCCRVTFGTQRVEAALVVARIAKGYSASEMRIFGLLY
jgi:hypothetical protein